MGSICRQVILSKAAADRFAPGDMLIDKFHGGEGVGATAAICPSTTV
jgi:hypothetical protein